ncbi:MAG: hypothetical protein HYY61_01250 [Deltaproteobacteria bacterium]|nr:hypothetical protein [Deltaproteobacteria bacterium]
MFVRLHNVYLKLLPAMAREEQLKIGEAFAARTARLAQKFGLRQQVAEKLAARIIVTRSATGIGVKKGFSGLLGRAVGLAKWAAPFMWGIGLLQIVFEPTEVGGEGDEIGPKERFNFLKENIEALEKNPHDLYLQDRVIQSTMGHLYDVINMLEYESNQTYLGFEELNARQDISAQDKESAQKELEEFWAEQDSLIEYFKITSEALKEIYYVEDSDRSKAEEILQETMKKLEAVF